MNIVACLMYKFEHVLCADFSMSYVNCSPNGLAVRLAASVQRPSAHRGGPATPRHATPGPCGLLTKICFEHLDDCANTLKAKHCASRVI